MDSQNFPHRVIETSCKKIDDNYMAQIEAEYLLPNQELSDPQFEPPAKEDKVFL